MQRLLKVALPLIVSHLHLLHHHLPTPSGRNVKNFVFYLIHNVILQLLITLMIIGRGVNDIARVNLKWEGGVHQ
jgi:hypothetical protein